jgi:hypothetical protein
VKGDKEWINCVRLKPTLKLKIDLQSWLRGLISKLFLNVESL